MIARVTCIRCGFSDVVRTARVVRACPAGGLCEWSRVCESDCPEGSPAPSGLRLGTMLANALAFVGITPARVSRVKAAVGLRATCGCGRRKAWLDRIL